MYAPAAVLAIVLFETAVGGLALTWLGPTWGRVRHGFEMLQAALLGLMALGAWAAMRGPLALAATETGSPALGWASLGLGTTAAAALLALVLLVIRAPSTARLVGIVSAVLGAATFVPIAQVRGVADTASGSVPLGVLELVTGAFFLGAVWNGMVLGHWYLVERRLSNEPMVWMAWANVAAVVAGFVSVGLSALNSVPCAGLEGDELIVCSFAYSPVLGVGTFTIMMGVGIVALVALISGFNVKLAREGGRSIQAATGMFYLAVILAPAAEFAAKVRFF